MNTVYIGGLVRVIEINTVPTTTRKKRKRTPLRQRRRSSPVKSTKPGRKRRTGLPQGERRADKKSRQYWRSKLTEKMIDEAVELIEEGLPLESTWAYMGISKHTGILWREKGEKFIIEMQTRHGPEFPEDELEARFCMAVAKARATLEYDLIKELRDEKAHARWVRNMTILERRYRQNWGRSETIRTGDIESMAPDEAYL